MRTAFAGDRPTDALIGELRTELPLNANVRIATTEPRRIVILATKEAHCLGDLLLRHAEGDIPAHVEAVISNYPTLGRLVDRFGVPCHEVSHDGRDRAEHEAAIRDVLAAYDPEFLVLAKYMRVLSPAFVAAYPARIVNIHHSFLPAFAGANPYRQAKERGVKLVGATAHYVTEELDAGPIIEQNVVRVSHGDDVDVLAHRGADVERLVLARAVQAHCEDRVLRHGNTTVVF